MKSQYSATPEHFLARYATADSPTWEPPSAATRPRAATQIRYVHDPTPYSAIADLTKAVLELKAEIKNLREELRNESHRADVECSDDEARRLVEARMREGGDIYPSDLAEELSLDYGQVLRVLEALQAEGLITKVP